MTSPDAPRTSADASSSGRTGGRVAGKEYAPKAPKDLGTGVWPNKDYSAVEPQSLRDTLEWWQDIVFDVREQRHKLGLQQGEVAARAGISEDTYERIERGKWVASYNLFAAMSVLGLHPANIVPVRRTRGRSTP